MGAGLRSAGRCGLCGRGEARQRQVSESVRVPPLPVCIARGPSLHSVPGFPASATPAPRDAARVAPTSAWHASPRVCRRGGVGGKAAAEAGAGPFRRLVQPQRVSGSGFHSLDSVALSWSPFASETGFKSQLGNFPLRVARAGRRARHSLLLRLRRVLPDEKHLP